MDSSFLSFVTEGVSKIPSWMIPMAKASMYGGLGVVVTVMLVKMYLKNKYDKLHNQLLEEQDMDMDSFCTAAPDKAKVALLHIMRMGSKEPSNTPIPLECSLSKHVKGLYVAKATNDGKSSDDCIPIEELMPRRTSDGSIDKRSKQTLVVATIRMGFGHHRLAYSACSWALSKNYNTIFHDLINIESPEASLIHSVDALYSKFSRLATELGGPIEKIWGLAMKQGDADALRAAAFFANHLKPLLLAYPKDIPMICTHQLCALVASAVGFTNVVNLVVDNYPQWFLVVPKTLNCVQGPVNYQSFIRMGVSPDSMNLAGHWCPSSMVDNIPKDCKRRLDMLKSPNKKPPLRLVIPVGGAGAQKKFITGLVRIWLPLLKAGKIQILLNAGDHTHMKAAFRECLQTVDVGHSEVTNIEGVHELADGLLKGKADSLQPVTLFAFDEYFPAVATTDILCRCSDILVCKPSELAFYPIPKLHIRRVGDHEADSARRACEVGDGSMEARTVEDALHVMTLLSDTPHLLEQMNKSILANHSIQMYHGCANAVALAVGK